MRILSLLPSATEIVCALGLADRLVGRSHSTVFIADGHHYFNRPGPRLVETLQTLAEILHPSLSGTVLEGISWEILP